MYFLENHDRLPEEAQKTAAANLITACEWHELEPPGALLKRGMELAKLAGFDLSGVRRALSTLGPRSDKAARAALEEAARKEGGSAAWKALKVGVPLALTAAAVPSLIRAEKKKALRDSAKEKKSSAMQPYVDVTGQQPPPRFSKRASQRHALDDRFPIDSCGQVKEAEAWFGDHGTSLHPAERRAFCQNLTARADELGMPIENDNIRKYAGEGYAPDGEIKIAVSTRLQYWTEDSPERDLLKSLMSKTASVPPEVFCESLRQFDEATGMNYHWDEGVCDPWYSTYGFTKTAEWSWESGNDRLTEDVLKKGACEHQEALRKKFGEEVALNLQKNPVQIFDSLPLDHKRIISRIINDPQ
jgi:hypothetical protein